FIRLSMMCAGQPVRLAAHAPQRCMAVSSRGTPSLILGPRATSLPVVQHIAGSGGPCVHEMASEMLEDLGTFEATKPTEERLSGASEVIDVSRYDQFAGIHQTQFPVLAASTKDLRRACFGSGPITPETECVGFVPRLVCSFKKLDY